MCVVQVFKERFKIDMPHRFKSHSYFVPTFCDLCGQVMHGIFRQGVKCEGGCVAVRVDTRMCVQYEILGYFVKLFCLDSQIELCSKLHEQLDRFLCIYVQSTVCIPSM